MRALLASLALAAPALAQGDNILLIVADDLGVDYVNAYGEGTNPPPTPNMPLSTPTMPPSPSRTKAFTDTSAIGR